MGTPPSSEGELLHRLGSLAVELEGHRDPKTVLHEIVQASVQIVPGARWAGISLLEGDRVESRAPTDQVVAELDQLQSTLDEGPCLSALREHHTVKIDDMASEVRWPRFAGAALDRGIRSLLAFRLFVRRGSLGALNLYGGETGVFDEESVLVGEVLAQHASVALARLSSEARFQRALDSRDVIGQAKGLLMERNNVDGLHAFRMLLKVSQETHTKLVDVARWLVKAHESGLS
ncbi:MULTISPECIES: GAF and ANTAR domain-containing protein [unclassified Mycobacterium]|uniref:GAF and ANTAR domain-containing protein n=1 Tax=unclassified Mycobacterium TaxID=2642494 RepID=UPI000F967672|nr:MULTISPECIES: GAF and ANTAR domain-containing protein [unclassified Mycobacterium]MDP7702785.1 GAF and ANTAR domain-containing protein [Mycobacterium sp. TY815]MDP7721275.1 GAF and ANTAR domain-containing protein [Mycobacterium sp. TY814]RUP05294.1 MAG: ANTAR domain-containing protein [Mycobacterium sp.]